MLFFWNRQAVHVGDVHRWAEQKQKSSWRWVRCFCRKLLFFFFFFLPARSDLTGRVLVFLLVLAVAGSLDFIAPSSSKDNCSRQKDCLVKSTTCWRNYRSWQGRISWTWNSRKISIFFSELKYWNNEQCAAKMVAVSLGIMWPHWQTESTMMLRDPNRSCQTMRN